MFQFDRERELTERARADQSRGRLTPRVRYTLRGAGVLCIGLLLSRAARADEATATEARAAYDAAAAAYNADDFRVAATHFARADELVPNPTVLKLALAAAVRAEDPVLSMNLQRRSERRGTTDRDLLELERVARARFESQVGFVEVRCRPGHACQARLAEQRLEPGLAVAVAPGKVELTFGVGNSQSLISVEVVAARTLEVLEPAEPAPAPKLTTALRPAPQRFHSTVPDSASLELPRGVFWGGVVLSGALTAVTVASGVDAAHAHDQFLDDRNEATRSHGQAAAERTNVLLGATLGTALITGAIGLFFTRWHSPSPSSSSSSASARLPSLTVAF